MRWPRMPRISGRRWLGPTPLASRPAMSRKRSAAPWVSFSRSCAESMTVIACGVSKVERSVRVAVIVMAARGTVFLVVSRGAVCAVATDASVAAKNAAQRIMGMDVGARVENALQR